MRYDPDAPTHDRNTVHYRRRAQRAEAELSKTKQALRTLQAEIAAERASLNDYLNSDRHTYDLMLGAQTCVAKAVRAMSLQHLSCEQCGGFSRKALDHLLEPTLIRMRKALDVPEPELVPEPVANRAGDWPVRPGQTYFRGTILRPFRTPEEEAEYNRPRFY